MSQDLNEFCSVWRPWKASDQTNLRSRQDFVRRSPVSGECGDAQTFGLGECGNTHNCRAVHIWENPDHPSSNANDTPGLIVDCSLLSFVLWCMTKEAPPWMGPHPLCTRIQELARREMSPRN